MNKKKKELWAKLMDDSEYVLVIHSGANQGFTYRRLPNSLEFQIIIEMFWSLKESKSDFPVLLSFLNFEGKQCELVKIIRRQEETTFDFLNRIYSSDERNYKTGNGN